MPCTRPVPAWWGPGDPRTVEFNPKNAWADLKISLKCGRCPDCRLKKAESWTIRCQHEAQMHSQNCFITLTYDPEHLPYDVSIDITHWQKFAKRLRKALGPFRFFHVGEYGTQTNRPHYHALLFGQDFSADRVLRSHIPGKYPVFSSATLDTLWGKGRTEIGTIGFESAAYVSQYSTKKQYGQTAAKDLERHDSITGETWLVEPPYVTMSRRPGLGTSWFLKYGKDVYPADSVIMNGYHKRPPAFYDNLHSYLEPEEHNLIKARRANWMSGESPDYRQLKARETIQQSKINAKTRETK